jgi:hypothetical protein
MMGGGGAGNTCLCRVRHGRQVTKLSVGYSFAVKRPRSLFQSS